MPRPCFRLTPLALAAALALPSLVFIVSPAHAQTSTAMPISLPAQSLGTALNELARQARLQLMVYPDLVADKQAPAVSGSLTPRQALDKVLAGSGLKADIQDAEVIIRRVPDTAESGVTTLAEMKVTTQGMDESTTEGTGSYTTRSMGTATGLVLSPRETPQSVSVITHQRIEDQRLVSVAEVLRNAPGVSYKAADRGRGGTTVRGFDLTNFQIDGVPTILDANMDIDNASIAIYDRIEVVRGATGLRSGAGNPAATINLVRKHAN
ncbi:MAG TPA: TonB-dependent receptor plug domain-containing protein, partial [Nitrosomonas europaea]|nr:TonB-dependent receptor plug domain-containing protein [Nitrosomonas europaea]